VVNSLSLPQNRHGRRSLQFAPRKQRQQTACKAQKKTTIIQSEAIIELHTQKNRFTRQDAKIRTNFISSMT
jgi:hypothetical protein